MKPAKTQALLPGMDEPQFPHRHKAVLPATPLLTALKRIKANEQAAAANVGKGLNVKV